jgi:long-subunit acyl-CoA synthetase (AMP-forming)
VASVVLDPEVLKKWAASHNLNSEEDQILENEELRQAVYDDMIQLAVVNKFNGLEKPK